MAEHRRRQAARRANRTPEQQARIEQHQADFEQIKPFIAAYKTVNAEYAKLTYSQKNIANGLLFSMATKTNSPEEYNDDSSCSED